ncbi:MAG: diacylglycerol kinase [Planctomycetota bacterium]|nr:diacylglycerol kinase [Planctomycetota bacterium]
MKQPSAQRGWRAKFGDAFRGCKWGFRSQSSFAVHLFAAVLAVLAGAALRISLIEWALIALSIAGVLSAEMLNTSIEHLARAISRQQDPNIARALDVAAAGVLMASLGATAVGLIVFGRLLWQALLP